MALTAYDLIGLDVNQLRICEEYKLQYKFPLWVKVMNSANHMFLVMNASGNIFLFIVTGTQVHTKATRVVEFSNEGYNIRKVFA